MSKPILLDGAVGTGLWEIAEKHGVEKVAVWRYNLEHPELVRELHAGYIDAGAQIILANTFGANGPMVKRGSTYTVAEVVTQGVKLAKEATVGTGVKVALAAGPLSALMEPYGDLEEEEVEAIYREMFDAGIAAGADLIMIQTFIDLGMMEVAAKAAKTYGVPVFCTLSFEKIGKTMFGNSVEDVIESLEEIGADAIGINCSVGPEAAVAIIREFASKTKLPLICKPNAGLPISNGTSTETVYGPEDFAREMKEILPLVAYAGGCCGTNASFIRALSKMMEE